MSDTNASTSEYKSWQDRFFGRDLPVAYLMVRATMGFHMIAHGGSRFPILSEFVAETREEFMGVTLAGVLPIFPSWVVTIIAYTIPPTEFVIGLLLAVGFKTRLASLAGNAMFLVMMFGQVALMNFGTAHVMWWYVLVFALLGALSFADRYSVDRMGK
ncbi:MAG: DoxX family membrane protein [Acidobacteria bacterium]|nr:DoxX family membrane protein [Acidobacteriota bacterium]